MPIAPVQSENQVTTGEVRLSYAHLFEPFSNNPQQDAKYSCVLIIPKSDKATIRAIKKAKDVAIENGKAKHFGGKVPPNLHSTIKDGDSDADLERNPEYEGCYYMSVSSKQAPGIIARDKQPILDAQEVYSGCYARVQMGAFAYNTNGNKGVSFGLNHVQKLKDGEPLAGGISADAAFADLDDADDDDMDDDDLI